MPLFSAFDLARVTKLLVTIGAVGIPSFSTSRQWPTTAGVHVLQCPIAIIWLKLHDLVPQFRVILGIGSLSV
jgi:hypothetical protein